MRKFSLPPQENLEGRILQRNDGAGSGVVADALTTCEPTLGRRRWARVEIRDAACLTSRAGHDNPWLCHGRLLLNKMAIARNNGIASFFSSRLRATPWNPRPPESDCTICNPRGHSNLFPHQ